MSDDVNRIRAAANGAPPAVADALATMLEPRTTVLSPEYASVTLPAPGVVRRSEQVMFTPASKTTASQA